MRKYDVYITKYLKGTQVSAGLVEQRTGKTVHKVVSGVSRDAVTNKMKRAHPNSMIHVFVKY